jgi:hypothetical protein
LTTPTPTPWKGGALPHPPKGGCCQEKIFKNFLAKNNRGLFWQNNFCQIIGGPIRAPFAVSAFAKNEEEIIAEKKLKIIAYQKAILKRFLKNR